MSHHEIDLWHRRLSLEGGSNRFSYDHSKRVGPVDHSRRLEAEREFFESGALKRERVLITERSRVIPTEDPGCVMTVLGLSMMAGIIWVGWQVAGWLGVAVAIVLIGIWTSN